MSPEASSIRTRAADVTLQEIDDLLDQVARLAQSEASPQAFHLEVLDRAVRALAAVGGAVWVRQDAGQAREGRGGGSWQIDSRVDLTGERLVDSLAEQPAHQELLESIIRGGQARTVLPHAGEANGPSPNPTEFLLLASPMALGDDGQYAGVLEVALRPGGAPASQQGYLRLLEALCEISGDYHRHRRLRVLQSLAAKAKVVDQFSLSAHASLDLSATACAIANEGRRLIDCDRLSVAVRRGNAFRLLAVSGLETLDPRANLVRRLEDLTEAVVAAGEPFWFAGETERLAPQIALPLHAWQDESHARALAIIPLATADAADVVPAGGAPAGAALIAECFGGDSPDEAYRQRVTAVCRHAELALKNSLEHAQLPFFRILSILQKARWFAEARQLPKTASIGIALLAAVLALVFIPSDFEIEARGVLQPKDRRDVYARSDGIVTEVRIEHAQACRAGDVLVVLTKSQLDFESSRVLGEIQTARKRLASVQAARLDVTPQTAADREKNNQLTGDEEEIQELLNSLEQQNEVLKAQREDLFVKSPLTGQVMTWNVRQSLESRPVQRGQMLMQVADLKGLWVLEVEIPDDQVGHVLEAHQKREAALPVSYMLATEPGATYRGTIEMVARATDVRPPEKASVLATIGVDRDQLQRLKPRPNATVVSRI